MSTTTENKLGYWENVTKTLIDYAIEAGLKLYGACDGEEGLKTKDVNEAACWAMQCGEGSLYFYDEDTSKNVWVLVIAGNEPYELVCDYVCNEKLDEAADQHAELWGANL